MQSSSFSEIARSLLAEGSLDDMAKVRETCGLLALLDLMGIIDTFFAGASVQDNKNVLPQSNESGGDQKSRDAHEEKELASDLQEKEAPQLNAEASSGLANILSMLPTVAGAGGQSERKDKYDRNESIVPLMSGIMGLLGQKDGPDLPVITSLVKILSSMAKTRDMSRPRQESQGKSGAPSASESSQSDAGDLESGSTQVDEIKADTDDKSKASPPGPDPLEIITGFLNLLAQMDMSKSRSPSKTRSPRDVSDSGQADERKEDAARYDTGLSVTQDGKTILIPLRRSSVPRENIRSVHKPGLGIKRVPGRGGPGGESQTPKIEGIKVHARENQPGGAEKTLS